MPEKHIILPRMNSAMYPKWLPLDKREDFSRRFDLAVLRYIEKWGHPPGWNGRRSILSGLIWAFKYGVVGSKAVWYSRQGKWRNKRLRRNVEARGERWREYMQELGRRGAAKRWGSRNSVIREPERKQKSWLEL